MAEFHFVADRLNGEPIAFLAMTNSEVKAVLGGCLALWTPVCLLLGFALGKPLAGLGAIFALVYLSMWGIGKRLSVIKRGKPPGYHVDALHAWLEDRGLKPRTLIRQAAVWDIR